MRDRGLSGYRKAYASKGDDSTFTRWVRDGSPRAPRKGRHGQPWLLDVSHPAAIEGRTVYPSTIQSAAGAKALLVSGHSNIKIGRDVRKGRMFRGYWIYTLSLQERATCPRSCQHWSDCYGNNMPLAKRIDHGDPALLMARLEAEIAKLLNLRAFRGRQVRAGLLIRLHALGDFFSPEYVTFWGRMLEAHPRLAVFGYTARDPATDIGLALLKVKRAYPDRFRIRWSGGGLRADCTISIARPEEAPAGAFVCPEQTGKVDACGKCGLCWATRRNVAFVTH